MEQSKEQHQRYVGVSVEGTALDELFELYADLAAATADLVKSVK